MGKPDLVVDQDQQYKITLKIEGKADQTAKGYKFITCPIFRIDRTSFHQGLEKLIPYPVNVIPNPALYFNLVNSENTPPDPVFIASDSLEARVGEKWFCYKVLNILWHLVSTGKKSDAQKFRG